VGECCFFPGVLMAFCFFCFRGMACLAETGGIPLWTGPLGIRTFEGVPGFGVGGLFGRGFFFDVFEELAGCGKSVFFLFFGGWWVFLFFFLVGEGGIFQGKGADWGCVGV